MESIAPLPNDVPSAQHGLAVPIPAVFDRSEKDTTEPSSATDGNADASFDRAQGSLADAEVTAEDISAGDDTTGGDGSATNDYVKEENPVKDDKDDDDGGDDGEGDDDDDENYVARPKRRRSVRTVFTYDVAGGGANYSKPKRPRVRRKGRKSPKYEEFLHDDADVDDEGWQRAPTEVSLPEGVTPLLDAIVAGPGKYGTLWAAQYRSLVAYKFEHGHSKVPWVYPPDMALGRWVNTQKVRGKKGAMVSDRRACLEALDFHWGQSGANGGTAGGVIGGSAARVTSGVAPLRVPKHDLFMPTQAASPEASMSGPNAGKASPRPVRKEADAGKSPSRPVRRVTDAGKVSPRSIAAAAKPSPRSVLAPAKLPPPICSAGQNTASATTVLPLSLESTLRSLAPDLRSVAVSTRQGPIWVKNFRSLVFFISVHGNTRVPHRHPPNPALGRWVGEQRYQLHCMLREERSRMTDKRRKCLDAVGFWWGQKKEEEEAAERDSSEAESEEEIIRPRAPRQRAPRQRARQEIQGGTLIESAAFGTASSPLPNSENFAIPICEEKDIERIITNLRREAGSRPAQRAHCNSWIGHFSRLWDFRSVHGHAKVPFALPANKRMGYWAADQRRELKRRSRGERSPLTAGRIGALMAVGFWWGKDLTNDDARAIAMGRWEGVGGVRSQAQNTRTGGGGGGAARDQVHNNTEVFDMPVKKVKTMTDLEKVWKAGDFLKAFEMKRKGS